MASVPYSPVPAVAQQNVATPGFRLNSPVEAFGGATAHALGNVGKALDKAGDEIFNRAIALQELDNQAQARQADTDYMIAAGELHAKYNSLQGREAVKAYPQYQRDLADARDKIRSRLESPMAQKLFDAQSMSTMGRTIFNGAGHAATENRQYLIGTAKAKIKAEADQALSMPNDERAFQQSVEATKLEVANHGNMDGWSPEQLAQAQAEAVSNLWSKRIEGLARTKPFEAQKMLDEALKRGDIRGEQQAAITNFVRTQTRGVGSRGISHDIHSGRDLYWGSQVISTGIAKNAIGTMESGNNYSTTGPKTRHGHALGKYGVMEAFLDDYLKRAGLPSMTPEAFLKSPDIQEKVFEASFIADMRKYGSFNEAASRWFTGKSVAAAREDWEKRGVTDATPGRKGTNINQYLAATNAIIAKDIPLGQKVERSAEMARSLAPDDPLMEDYARQRVETDNAQFHRVKLAQNFEDRQTIETGLMGGQDNKVPTNLDELKANTPNGAEAWSRLNPDQQRRYLSVLAKNGRGDVAWSTEGLSRYQTLKGMAENNPGEFMDAVIVDEDKLPLSARKELLNLQNKKKANAQGDPRVTKAITLIRGSFGAQLQALGIYSRTKDNAADYDHFTGALQTALDDYLQTNKKPADDQYILKEIAPKVLQERIEPGFFGMLLGGKRTPFFKQEVPRAFSDSAKQSAVANGEIEPNEEQVYRAWLQYQWLQLNQKAKPK